MACVVEQVERTDALGALDSGRGCVKCALSAVGRALAADVLCCGIDTDKTCGAGGYALAEVEEP